MVGVDRRGRRSKINKNVWTSKNTDDKEKEKKKRQLPSILRYTLTQKMILIEDSTCLVLSSRFPVKDVFRSQLNI